VVELGREHRGHRSAHADAAIAPARRDAVTAVLRRDVAAADKCLRVVKDQQLAVVPERERRQAQFIEPAHRPAGSHQLVEIIAPQSERANRVHDQPHAHPAPRRRRKRRPEAKANVRIPENERLHAHERPCRVNGAQLGFQQALPRAIPGETVRVGHVSGMVMKRRAAPPPI
jgi:hypothetical protein